MRRLFQLGILCLFLAAFVSPLAEVFDRWDLPGIENDTEFAVFVLVLALCLVLLVSQLVSALALLIRLVARPHQPHPEPGRVIRANGLTVFYVPPHGSPPLRI